MSLRTLLLGRREPDPEPDETLWPSPSAAQKQIDALAEQLRLQQIERGRVYVESLEDAMATFKRAIQVWDTEVRDVALAPEHVHQLPTDVWDAINKMEMELRAPLAAMGVAAQARQAVIEGVP